MKRIYLSALVFALAGCAHREALKPLAPEVAAQTQLTRDMVDLLKRQQATIEKLMAAPPKIETKVNEAILVNKAMEKKVDLGVPELNIQPPPAPLAAALKKDLTSQMGALNEVAKVNQEVAVAATQAADTNKAALAVGDKAVTKGEENTANATKQDTHVAAVEAENVGLKSDLKKAHDSDLWTWFMISGATIVGGLFLAFATPVKKFGWYLALLGAIGCCVTYFFITVLKYFGWLLLASAIGGGIYAILRMTGTLKAVGTGVEELKNDPAMPSDLVEKYFGSHGAAGRFHWLNSEYEGVVDWLRKKIGSEPAPDSTKPVATGV